MFILYPNQAIRQLAVGGIEEAAMTETIMPSFDRYAKEGNTIGRLLPGYGELELEMCACVAATTNDLDAAIKKLFRTRGEKNRIKTADSMMTARYISAGLGTKYRRTLANMDWCRTVRNQYAHCNWYDTSEGDLCFVDLEHTAKLKKKIVSVAKHRYPIDATLLIQQEQYFRYVQKCFWYLVESYKSFKGEQRYGRSLFTWPALLEPVALAVQLQNMDMMREAIEKRAGRGSRPWRRLPRGSISLINPCRDWGDPRLDVLDLWLI